jgi:hypothetical protein
VSSNISQSYPAGSETESQRAAAVAKALAAFPSLSATVAAETTPLGEVTDSDNGAPARWWVWVCPNPADEARGRLHVVGYALENHALYVVCDTCGTTYLR